MHRRCLQICIDLLERCYFAFDHIVTNAGLKLPNAKSLVRLQEIVLREIILESREICGLCGDKEDFSSHGTLNQLFHVATFDME